MKSITEYTEIQGIVTLQMFGFPRHLRETFVALGSVDALKTLGFLRGLHLAPGI